MTDWPLVFVSVCQSTVHVHMLTRVFGGTLRSAAAGLKPHVYHDRRKSEGFCASSKGVGCLTKQKPGAGQGMGKEGATPDLI